MPPTPESAPAPAAGLPRDGFRLLAVHAHPDDESSKGAAATAMYVAQGARVCVVSCTGGERGDVLNETLKHDPHIQRDIAQVRRDEMAAAAAALGVEHVWLGFVDSGLPEGDPLPPLPEGCFALEPISVTTEALVRVIREFRPHVVTTYDEHGGYPHPDHIMTHKITMAAVRDAADPTKWPEHGEPWQVVKVYYHMTFHRRRFEKLDEVLHENGHERVYAERLSRMDDHLTQRLTTFVPCAEYFHVRDDALRAHATQIDPDGFWFAVPLAIQKLGWPTEDYQLVKSMVPVTLPENDLFAGLDTHFVDKLDTWFYSI